MRNLVYNHPVSSGVRPAPAYAPPMPALKTIPFDYVFQFSLKGQRGNKVQDVVEISTEGAFMALSMGYSLALDERKTPRTFQPQINPQTIPQNPLVVPLFSQPEEGPGRNLEGLLIAGTPDAEIKILDFTDDACAGFSPTILTPNPIRIGAGGTVTVDLPNLNNSGTLRVWDLTNNLFSDLFDFNLTRSGAMIGPNAAGKLPTAGDGAVFAYGFPGDDFNIYLFENATKKIFQIIRVIPNDGTSIFFRLSTIQVSGRDTGRVEVPLKIRENNNLIVDKKLAPGDLLLIKADTFDFPFSTFAISHPRPSTVTLGALAAGLEKIGADLFDGFRFNPDLANVLNADLSLSQLSSDTLSRAFETGGVSAEEVSFLYSLDVSSTGREYQNRAIHNVAGLGIANGDRPFRAFAKPIAFEPRSAIRIQVEELAGPSGTLYVVLQGYKILGSGPIR